jgi:hypothetical protein
MSEPTDPRGRNVDPFDAPDDYADPWRGRLLIVLVSFGMVVLGFVLWLVLS